MMTLACGDVFDAQLQLGETIVWSIALLAPVATFLLLPKTLPLGRELFWLRTRLLVALGWIVSRLGGHPEEARGWVIRARAAWRQDVEAHHPPRRPDDRVAEVARDGKLLRRARMVGWAAMAVIVGLGVWAAATVFVGGGGTASRGAVSILVATVVAALVGRIAGDAAGLYGQALALGRGPWARLGLGALVGTGWGAVAGAAAGFFALWAGVPVMSLLTVDTLSSREMMLGLEIGGVLSAIVGAAVGCLTVATVAAAARRRRRPSPPPRAAPSRVAPRQYAGAVAKKICDTPALRGSVHTA